jgi:SAM-dependent methyltransferase
MRAMHPDHLEPRRDDSVRRYFGKIYADYQESVEKDEVADVHRRIKAVVEPRLAGLVLDIGSGGDTRHRNSGITTLVSVDNVVDFLRHAKDPAAVNAAGDIRALPFKDASADRIVAQFVIHHLAEDNFGGTFANVRAAVGEAARILKPGGTVFLIDSMTFRPLDWVQRRLYRVSRFALRRLGRPMVFIFSARSLTKLLAASGLTPERPKSVDWGRMTDLSQALFPKLRFPLKYAPVRPTILAASKPR